MEQNAVPDATPASVAERTGEVRPAGWMKFHQVKGAKEILERTGRLPAVLRFKAPQTVYAIRIPDGQTYRITLPDGRKLRMAEGVNEIDPPVLVKAADEIRLRCLEAAGPANRSTPAQEELDAHLDTFWSDPALVPGPTLPTGSRMAAVEDEAFDELDADALEPLEETPASLDEGATLMPLSAAGQIRPPVLTFGLRLERHPGLLARLFGTSGYKEGSR